MKNNGETCCPVCKQCGGHADECPMKDMEESK